MNGVPTPGAPDLVSRMRLVAREHPDRPAIVVPEGAWTFRELDARVIRLAALLRAHGAAPGALIGVCLPRCADLVATLLAVWTVGAAYLPLDPTHPRDRLTFMAEDAGAGLVVSSATVRNRPAGVRFAWVDRPDTPDRHPPPVDRTRMTSAADPAYVIHTSGSTGRPKGVRVSHGNVAFLIRALERSGLYPDRPRRVAWNAGICFDASVQQWIRVCRGDTLVLLDEELRAEPASFAAYVSEHGVTDLDLTPSHWQMLGPHIRARAAERHAPLRLFVGGEPIPRGMWADLAQAANQGWIEAVNVYGPTECTVDATAAWIRGTEPHIGAPLPGVRAHVLDARLKPLGDGEAGELYLAGPGLADGYVERPALTAQRFVADVSGTDGSRMYRTGDRARWQDGRLIYLGRTDRQLKLHGHRIELDEIEAVLAEHPDLDAVAVGTREHDALGRIIVAYYVSTARGAMPSTETVRAHLRSRLPKSMIPVVFIMLDAMPVTGNGKIDRRALSVMPMGAPETAEDLGGAAAGVAGPMEELVAETWAVVLGRVRVSATDNFFELGGHSLVALQMVTRLRSRLGVAIPTKTVYRHPRLRDLAAHLRQLCDEATTVGPDPVSPDPSH